MIGILDSKLSGLILAKEIIDKFSEYQILYFTDTARGPLGNKGKDTIKKCTKEGIDFLINKGAQLIIVADQCMATVAQEIWSQNNKIPVIGLVDWLIDSAIKSSQNKRIGLIAPRAVIDSGFIPQAINQIDKRIKVLSKATPLLWPLIQEDWTKRIVTKKILKAYLYELHCQQIDTLILGDLAYCQLQSIIQRKIGKQVKIISLIDITPSYFHKFLEDNLKIKENLSQGSLHQFFISDINIQAQVLVRRWFGSKIQLKEI
ncbi:MAG: hypothetical protein Q7J06_03950 [Bacteroidales bacterium]|nr:hypothetical protein [Bacteroidales bacterium]